MSPTSSFRSADCPVVSRCPSANLHIDSTSAFSGWLMVRDAVKVDRHADAPYPAAIRSAAGTHDNAPADTPAEDVAVVEATDGQEG